DVEYLHQSPADGTANAGTDHPEQPALQQEHPQDLPPWTAHRPQDADLPGALHDADRQYAGNTEGHGDADKYPDHLGGHALGDQGVEQLAVGLHPAFRLQPGQAFDPPGQVIGGKYLVYPGVDHGHATGQRQQRLGLLEIEANIARIQLTHAKFENTGDINHRLPAVATVQPQLVTYIQPQIPRQLAADDCMTGADPEDAGNQVLADRDDALIAQRVHANQRHRRPRHPAERQRRTADHRRHRRQPGMLIQQGDHVLPVADRTQPLRPWVFPDQRDRALGQRDDTVELIQ